MIAEVQPPKTATPTEVSKPSKRLQRSRKRAAPKKVPTWHAVFLPMLPAIRTQARFAFAHLDPEARGEAMQEVAASATVAFKDLWDRGKADVEYPPALARYGIRRAKIGRKVGGRLNIRDVSSDYCQVQKNVAMGRLDHYDRAEGGWLEVLIEGAIREPGRDGGQPDRLFRLGSRCSAAGIARSR